MTHRVAVRPAALADLTAIYDWIADQSDPETARAYRERLLAACSSLSDFPGRGSMRGDLAPGVRTISFEGRAVIAYRVAADAVEILRIFPMGVMSAGPSAAAIQSNRPHPRPSAAVFAPHPLDEARALGSS